MRIDKSLFTETRNNPMGFDRKTSNFSFTVIIHNNDIADYQLPCFYYASHRLIPLLVVVIVKRKSYSQVLLLSLLMLLVLGSVLSIFVRAEALFWVRRIVSHRSQSKHDKTCLQLFVVLTACCPFVSCWWCD